MFNRLIRAGDAVSQLLNVTLLNGQANESISGRCYRQGWKIPMNIIDIIMSPFEKDHCKLAFDNDLKRATDLVSQYGNRVT